MIEGLRTLAMALAMVALLGALGSGPAVWLARGVVARAAAAPIIGLGLAASALSTAAYVVSIGVAVWAVLLPLTVASMAWAAWGLRGAARPRLRLLLAPAAGAAAALAAGVAPAFWRGTTGPLSLASGDAWGYVFPGLWMNDHSMRDALTEGAGRTDLPSSLGWTIARFGGDRQGSNLLSGAFAEVLQVPEADIHLAFLAAMLALIPLAIWIVARFLGASAGAAVAGSLLGASPAVVALATDSRLGNLAGLVLIPVVLVVVAHALARGGRGPVILAALLVGGLLANYVLFLIPLAVLVGIGAVVVGALRWRAKQPLGGPARAVGIRVLAIVAGAVVVSPVALARLPRWYDYINGEEVQLSAIPGWNLAFDNGLAWAFGLLHLHELGEFDDLALPLKVLAVAIPLALAAIVVLGGIDRGLPGVLLVLAPIGITVLLSGYSYFKYDDCVYCVWKALTMLLPFLGVGLALGIDRLVRRSPGGAGGRGRAWYAVAAVGAVALIGLVRAEVALVRDWQGSNAALTEEARDLPESIAALPEPVSLMLEGIDATPAPGWTLLELTYLAHEGRADLTSMIWAPFGPGFYTPDYGYVATPFGGLRGERRLVARHGTYSLFERAPLDVVIADTGWSVAPEDAPNALPWVSKPFELNVASARTGPGHLEVDYLRPLRRGSIAFFDAAWAPLPTATSARPPAVRACIDLDLVVGRNIVRGLPVVKDLPALDPDIVGLWPQGSPVKALGVSRLVARPGACSG